MRVTRGRWRGSTLSRAAAALNHPHQVSMHDILKVARRPAELKQYVDRLREGQMLQHRAEVRAPVKALGTHRIIKFQNKRVGTVVRVRIRRVTDGIETGKLNAHMAQFGY